METPIVDFVRAYEESGTVRLHMPGHKGRPILGAEPFDITEVHGADALYEAGGIIAESEKNASNLFGTAKTLYSTEGSSQCIRAMVHLAVRNREKPWILAARNAHKAFLYALALNGCEVEWLWPEEMNSICACAISPAQVEAALQAADRPPAAVYVTSPDYLGNRLDIRGIGEVCRRYGTLLLVDNAHGAYLHFLPEPAHPMDLGADLCCDSAHKTLPVLTGGAYLHIGRHAPAWIQEDAKSAMELFGSTSPSYLILASLDHCNGYLAEDFPGKLAAVAEAACRTRALLRENGWEAGEGEPLKITIHAPAACPGPKLAALLRESRIECEYADPDYLVLMVSAETTREDLNALTGALGENTFGPSSGTALPMAKMDKALPPREALFRPREVLPVSQALGRIAASPMVGCPPAIPIVVSGEIIAPSALELFARYGIHRVSVLK